MKENTLIDISALKVFEAKTKKVILDSFDFTLKRGETHSIVGESGSGKTTFILALFSLLHTNLSIQYKKFQLLGKNISNFSENDWENFRGKKIALIPQNPSVAFHPFIKIGNQIQEFLNFNQLVKFEMSEIIRAIESVGIENAKEKLQKFPSQVSGGERQRMLIASSVLANPEILVADEPTSSLDPINAKNILDLFKKIASTKKIGLLIVSHDIRFVQSISNHITVLRKGETIEIASIKKNTISWKNTYSKLLFSLKDFYKNPRQN